MTRPVRVAVAYHAGYGHTGRQARAVADGAAGVSGTHVELWAVDEPGDELMAALDRADAVIFGAPTCMGAASAAFRTFAEVTSKAWGDDLRWQGEVAAGFTNSQNLNGNLDNTLVEMFVLAAQPGMHWVSLGAYGGWNTTTGRPDDLNRLGGFTGVMAQSHGDLGPEHAPPPADLTTAAHLGRRVAETTAQLLAGRAALEGLPTPDPTEQQTYDTATAPAGAGT